MIDTSDLRPWQRDYVEHHAFDVVRYLMAEARLGKTRAELRCMELRQQAGALRQLVVGPKKPLELTWTEEIAMRGLLHVNMHSGTVAERYERLIAHMDGPLRDTPTIITINYDVLEQYHEQITTSIELDGKKYYRFRRRAFETLAEARAQRLRSNSGTLSDELIKWGPQDIIVDEAQLISSAGSSRTGGLWRLGRVSLCRRLLSGTPDPNGSVNFYSQMKFLDSTIFDSWGTDAKGNRVPLSGSRKTDFLAQYAIVDPHNHHILCYKNIDELLSKVFRVSYRVRARDVYGDVPEENITRTISWPVAARKLYMKLHRQHVLTTEDDGLAVDGTHKLTRRLRHQQMCSGFIVDQDTKELRWVQREKIDALVSELGEIVDAGKMCVVSYSYTVAGEDIARALAEKYGAERVALVNGDTSEREANAVLRLFDINNATETPLQILVLQEQVGGMGISLARATYMIFFSWTMDYNIHEQMRKRIWNETRCAFYIYLEMQQSVDILAREIVKQKHLASIMQREHLNWEKLLNGDLSELKFVA